MNRFCPLNASVGKAIPCSKICAWFSEDVDACAIWKIAEGFTIMTAFVNEILEKSQKVAQEILEKQKYEAVEDDGETRQQSL